MAGSYTSPNSNGSDVSQMVHERLEGLKLVAHHLDEPIVIFNPQMELVYANPSADRVAKECPLVQDGLKENHPPPFLKQEHCEPCPGKLLFEGIALTFQSSASSPRSSESVNPACPLPRAISLSNEEGTTQFAILMGARGSESVVTISQAPEELAYPDQQRPLLEEVPNKTIIGESEPIQRLVEMIQLVAASEASVLIQGESGTGKELVAKTVHALSRRRAQPFVVIECSSLPETLLESELFGHVRGAFTGAVADRKGLFEEAEGGTIFLDEISETTPAFQARLLRVLQECEVKPVGSNQSIKVNVRVLSAANQSLEQMVKAKTFRADLYYRLAILPLMVPSLRERQEDIALLVTHFLQEAIRQHGRPSMTLHPDAQRALVQHSWPGNVRELENVIERAVVTSRTSIIQVSDLFGNRKETHADGDLSTVSQAARREAERGHILQALSSAKGDKTRAARLLKISCSSLYNKLRTYNIS